ISATNEEKEEALKKIKSIREFLTARQWPKPIFADSGNGYHLLYRVDLQAHDGGIIEQILKALANRFDDEKVKIDQGVYNPARICKLPGTKARKGDYTETRPHRTAGILEVPHGATEFEHLPIVPDELLKSLAAEELPEQIKKDDPASNNTAHQFNGQRKLEIA